MKTNKIFSGFLLTTCLSLTSLSCVLSQSQDGSWLYQVGQSFTNFSDSDSWTLQGSGDPCKASWPGVTCYKDRVNEIILRDIGLGGTFNNSVVQLTNLFAVDLSYNNLTGSIPPFGTYDSAGGQLTSGLTYLDLQNNSFNGTIPTTLANLNSLRHLNLSYNNLSGSIPLSLFFQFYCESFVGNPLLNTSGCLTTPPPKHSNIPLIVALSVGVPVLLICCCVVWALFYRRKRLKRHSSFALLLQNHFVKQISYKDIKAATDNFNNANKLGAGGYSTVYKGVSATGELWAVKRAKSTSRINLNEFEREVDVISKMAHTNIVRLLGFCDEHNEQILVYEFMQGGTLRSRLEQVREAGEPPLTFPQRVDIAIGVAEGLRYLHNFARPPIIHRDVKSDNILLGSNLEAKIADFGLLKDNSVTTNKLLNTRVAGTPGYIDPEYFSTFQVTTKSDVFSFGVVLLELITGMGAIVKDEAITDADERGMTALTSWSARYLDDYKKLADPALQGEYNHDAMMELIRLARSCTERSAKNRPEMEEVTRRLQKVKNLIDGVADETKTGDDLAVGRLSSQPAVPSPAGMTGNGTNSDSYYYAPVSGRFVGR